MAFQRFIGQREVASAPKVTISARGIIDFNEGATRRFALGRFNYVILFYDDETNQIGIQFVNYSTERGALKVIKKQTGVAIPATSFLQQHNLLQNHTGAYNMLYSGEHDMYIIQLLDRSKAVQSEDKAKEPSPSPQPKEPLPSSHPEAKRTARVKRTVSSQH
jgi:hypothetical protein